MLFSIIVPVYNGEKYLRDCLDSCLEQDLPASEFEIICVDDGSTDGSLAILREYETNFPNVHVIVLPKSKGAGAARNAVLEQMQGKWYLFLDCDDFLAKSCFLKAKECLAKNDDAVLCIGRFHFEENGLNRLHSVIRAAIYIRKKYGLENPNVFRFFRSASKFPLRKLKDSGFINGFGICAL